MLAGAITFGPLGALVAFGAGILSFLSPCVLPLVPGYLSLVSGLSAAELSSKGGPRGDRHAVVAARELALVGAPSPSGPATRAAPSVPAPSAPSSADPLSAAPSSAPSSAAPSASSASRPTRVAPTRRGRPERPLAPLLRGVVLFVIGFTVVFVALGATASGVGHLLISHKSGLVTVSGAVIVVLGTVMLVSTAPAGVWHRLGPRVAGRAAWLIGDRHLHVRPEKLGVWAAPVLGMAFAFAWTPCLGPVLGAVLALTFTRATLAGGVVLLFAYSLGLGVPFLLTGIAFDRLTGFFARARKPLAVVQVLAGAVLVAFGAILLAGDLGWLSAQFSSLLDHLGLERLTVS